MQTELEEFVFLHPPSYIGGIYLTFLSFDQI